MPTRKTKKDDTALPEKGRLTPTAFLGCKSNGSIFLTLKLKNKK